MRTRETAESLADSVRSSMPMHAPEHLTIIGDAPSYRIIVQVYDSANNSLWQRENTPALPLPDGPGFGLSKVDGRDWRTYSVAVGPLVITAGQDLAVRTSSRSNRILSYPAAAVSAPSVHCYCCLIVVGSGLAPLERTARSIARRSPTSLQPISTKGLSSELASLVNAINSLLARLGESLSAQQRFASDAAHELHEHR